MAYDVMGNIAIIKLEKITKKEKLKLAGKLLQRPGIKTVLAQGSNIKGRLRTIKTEFVMGERNLIADYKENECKFRFNVETCYFSPRLSGERKLIAEKIKMKDSVLVMFAGVGAYPIVINKISKPRKIVGIEIGRDCCKWFKENLKMNRMSGKIEVIQGDVKKKIDGKEKYDVVVMARPNLKESFLKWGLMAGKKGTKLFYYGFCNVDEIEGLIKDLINEAKEFGRKIKLVDVKRAGDIAPYKFRYRIEFKVLG